MNTIKKEASDFVVDVVNFNKDAKSTIGTYGNTPIIYAPKKSWLKKPKNISLLDQIKTAISVDDVGSILKMAEGYKSLHPKTLQKIKTKAENRIKELNK